MQPVIYDIQAFSNKHSLINNSKELYSGSEQNVLVLFSPVLCVAHVLLTIKESPVFSQTTKAITIQQKLHRIIHHP